MQAGQWEKKIHTGHFRKQDYFSFGTKSIFSYLFYLWFCLYFAFLK